jgi:hypothetical protein
MTTAATTACSASGSRWRSRAARRSPRRATRSSAGRSGGPTSNCRGPFTLDHPAYNWFALGRDGARGARLARRSATQARASRRDRYRRGGRHGRSAPLMLRSRPRRRARPPGRHVDGLATDGHRYGVLHIDSNLPDVRLAIGGPTRTHSWLRSWTPPRRGTVPSSTGSSRTGLGPGLGPRGEDAHQRASRSLTCGARASCPCSSSRARIARQRCGLVRGHHRPRRRRHRGGPAGRAGRRDGSVEDYTVAVLNRGIPGFNVEADGSMYLSLLRSCSGWPSGCLESTRPSALSRPDRRANFQMQHRRHRFRSETRARGPGARRLARSGHRSCRRTLSEEDSVQQNFP